MNTDADKSEGRNPKSERSSKSELQTHLSAHGEAKLNPVVWLHVVLVVVATSCAATGNNSTTTKDISGFPIKEGQILIEHPSAIPAQDLPPFPLLRL